MGAGPRSLSGMNQKREQVFSVKDRAPNGLAGVAWVYTVRRLSPKSEFRLHAAMDKEYEC